MVGVGAGIRAVPDVGLDLDDAPDQPRTTLPLAHEITAHQLPPDLEAGAVEERAR
jgi:hypothetical protein